LSDDELLFDLASFEHDPLGFVMWAFPWGEENTVLHKAFGPEPWQRTILMWVAQGVITLDQAIQIATASGHGVGKSALCAWLVLWAISTREDTRGVVTANTETQLRTKTWAELGKWYSLFIAKHLFKLTPTSIFSSDKAKERTWRIDMVPWSERNTEAFAGLHNQGQRILLLFDEASAIPDLIWEVAEGILTDKDTQIIWAVFGNPTRNTGRFKDCFNLNSPWQTQRVDNRTVSFTNKIQISQWIEAYGENSDFVKIRILGEFPAQGEMEFFIASEIDLAMGRDVEPGGALVLGVDVARFGSNFSVLFPRRGRDARSIDRRRFQGLSTVDLASKVQEAYRELRVDGVMIDGGGVGGGVVDQVRHLQLHCFDVQFGSRASQTAEWNTLGEVYANKRAEMYGSLRSWIKTGALPNDADLRKQLLSITYTYNLKDAIVLTSKEVMQREGKDSPDDVDALALTFAMPVESRNHRLPLELLKPETVGEYHPYGMLTNPADYNPLELA
jgi:hypothetical protein